MKTIKFVGYLFYRYYSKGPRASIPYFSALCSMTTLGFFHLFQIMIVFNKVYLIPINVGDDKFSKRIAILLVMIPIYLLMTRLFKKNDIHLMKEKYELNQDKISRGNISLIAYTIISFAFIFILATLKN